VVNLKNNCGVGILKRFFLLFDHFLFLDWWSGVIKGKTTYLSIRRGPWNSAVDGTWASKWKE